EIELIDEARFDVIAKFTEQLSPRQQAVFSLLLQGKSVKEIAEIQGNTYNTIKHNKRLIVKKLKKYFADNGEEFEYDKVSGTI
ncbi:helix-turn-helix domain-containing protein, partial [Klebsiella pneumoniae]|uniref:helix-turn-helix domain-containing protein n=1 Tax=Klebsiella pneumoniae TaxID=573 RepID=UPI003A80E8EC